MRHPFRLALSSILLAALLGAIFIAPATAAPSRVLILPFKMNAPQDTTYLQQGIWDMLASRLAWADRVEVISKGEAYTKYNQVGGDVTAATARDLAGQAGADYVIHGSVTVIGQNVSLDATMNHVTGGRPPVTVSTQSQGLDGVIPIVNDFAEQINAQAFGRGSSGTATAYRPPPEPAAPPPQEETPAYRRHPDYLLSGVEGRQLSPLNPNFVVAVGADAREGDFWRSPSLRVQLVGMDIGDVNGDGANEIVYASTTGVYVARYDQGRLVKLAQYDGYNTDRYLTLDLADLNNNGRPEVFVSNQRDKKARSLVLEMQGDRLTPVAKDLNMFFRKVHMPTGPQLLGQRGGILEIFDGPISAVQYSGGEYAPVHRVNVPREVNLFNFAQAPLTGSASYQVVHINKDSKLIIMSSSGEELWTSQERFAETENYMIESYAYDQQAKDKFRHLWLPSRIIVKDLNMDNQPEIVVAQNERRNISSWFQNVRDFKRGAIHSLGYNQMSMRELWRSRKLPGALVDYQIKDYDNNGRADLVVALVMKGESGMGKGKSAIVAYELATPQEMQAREAEAAR